MSMHITVYNSRPAPSTRLEFNLPYALTRTTQLYTPDPTLSYIHPYTPSHAFLYVFPLKSPKYHYTGP